LSDFGEVLRKKHAARDALISGISHWAPLSLAAIFFCYIKLFRTGRRSRPPPSPPRGRGHNAADRPNRRVERSKRVEQPTTCWQPRFSGSETAATASCRSLFCSTRIGGDARAAL